MDREREYSRDSPDGARNGGRERDEYRSNDSYRDRRRSPDRRRERRRSRSPTVIDRYQPDRSSRGDYPPRRDYDDRRSRPQGERTVIDRYVPGQDQQTPYVNPLPDPLKLDFQVGFKWFAEWWRAEQRIKEEKERGKGRPPRIRGDREVREEKEQEKPKIQAAYDQYKENLCKAQAATFVRQHKDEDWFKERYVAETRKAFQEKLKPRRRELYAAFESALTEGAFDDFTLEGIYKSESNGQGGVLEKEEGETVAAAEVLQTGDLLPALGADMRDPAALEPTLLLKTIAPTVTREKLEAFAKERLGEGEDGFSWLSLSDPNPLKKSHRMGWIVLNPGSGSDAMEVNNDEGEENGEALSAADRALKKIDAQTVEDPERGNFTIHAGVHRPPDVPRKKALWDLFSAPERIKRDLDLAIRLVRKFDNELGDECFGGAKIEARVMRLYDQGHLKPTKPEKSRDFDIMDELEEGEEPSYDDDEVDAEDLLVNKKKLDLLVEYLRRVYSFCFFCVFESDSVHELQRKCPGGHLRRPRASLTTAAKEVAQASAAGKPFPDMQNGGKADDDFEMTGADSPVDTFPKASTKANLQLQRAFSWVKTYEEKILQILEPENVNLRKLGGVPLEEGLEEELKKLVKQEDANKFRCLVPSCTKLFKGIDFWRKHIELRHEETFTRVKTDLQLINTYVLDPAHIAPSRSDANSNGHFPVGSNGMPTGTPRGFSLQQHMPMGFANGMPVLPPGVAPGLMMASQGHAGWVPPVQGVLPSGQLMGGVGPVRGRGAYNGGYRSTGPYARPERGGRAPSFSGRAEPSDFQTITGAVGPREATQGRTVRSYEDLDAAGSGEKEPELDY